MIHTHDFIYLLKLHGNGDHSGQVAELNGCFASHRTIAGLEEMLKENIKAYLKQYPKLHNEMCRMGELPHKLPESNYGRILSIMPLKIECELSEGDQ